VSAVEDRIDDLYRLPLDQFTAARNALAKSLKGDDARRVRAMAKPTVVPWAVNQVYWRARATYDRLLKSGARLRAAQVAALEGSAADVREADEAHRRAIADAVAEAERFANDSGSQPAADALTRTFEALSLASSPLESPGRLTEALQPSGFEALAGVKLPEPAERPRPLLHVVKKPAAHAGEKRLSPAAQRAADEKERAAEEQSRQQQAALKKAEAALARAAEEEKEARATWDRAHDALLEARRELARLKSEV
jgi:hypothetical protein